MGCVTRYKARLFSGSTINPLEKNVLLGSLKHLVPCALFPPGSLGGVQPSHSVLPRPPLTKPWPATAFTALGCSCLSLSLRSHPASSLVPNLCFLPSCPVCTHQCGFSKTESCLVFLCEALLWSSQVWAHEPLSLPSPQPCPFGFPGLQAPT